MAHAPYAIPLALNDDSVKKQRDISKVPIMRSNLHSKNRICGVFAAVMLCASFAQAEVKEYPACEGEPTESDVSAAKGAYEAGEVSFQEADYERSILYWEDAFRRDCTAVKLLLNLARAYELSGDREHAVNSLETYIERRPDARDRGSVEKRIEKLKETIEEEKKAAPIAVPADSPDAEEKPPAADTAPVETSDEPKSKKPIWPVVVTGTGIAVALTGHAIAAYGETLREDKANEVGCNLSANECPDDQARDIANAAGKQERDTGAGIATLGHLTGITGGVLWWILWTQAKDTDSASKSGSPYIAPVLSHNYQGVSVSGSF